MGKESKEASDLAARIQRWMDDAAQYDEGQVFDLYAEWQPLVIKALDAYAAARASET
jgi:hypothetical protein